MIFCKEVNDLPIAQFVEEQGGKAHKRFALPKCMFKTQYPVACREVLIRQAMNRAE